MKDKYDPAKDKKINEIIDNEKKYSTPQGQKKLEDKANKLYRDGKLDEAYEAYSKILKSNPMNIKTILQMVGCREKMGDFEGAEELCNVAIEIHPGEPQTYLFKGRLNLRRNNLKSALKDFKTGKEFGSKICEEMYNRLKTEIENT